MNYLEKALKKTTDTKALIIEEGAMKRAPEMFRSLFGNQKAIVVADTNTWKAAGQYVQKYLEEAGIVTEKPFIFEDSDLFAEWSFLMRLENYLKGIDAVAIAVGSGVINDLTKLSSDHLGRRYMIVGTAVSMDGYTAYGASVTFEGNKQTFDCRAPYGAIIDPAIAAKAPKELAASGYADLIAKVPAAADWMIAEAAGVEPINHEVFDLVQGPLRESLSKPDAVFAGEVRPTEMLAEGLIMSGFAMQALQSSRPASGMEHQFSHYWDMENLCFQGKHVSHGFKVGIGTLVSTACQEFLLNYPVETIDVEACVKAWPSWGEQELLIKKIFEKKPSHMQRALKESKAKYVTKDVLRVELANFKAVWPELKKAIRKQIMSFDEVYDDLKRVHAPYKPEMIGVSNERLKETFEGIPFMRSRFTCIDLLYRAGLLSQVEDALFGPNGHWPVNK
jgi:glycerol-1-phosphate dehydrogenase [NAD(P)+]